MAHPNADEYLEQAAQCDKLAREARNAEARGHYMEMADAWRTLADCQAWEVAAQRELKSA